MRAEYKRDMNHNYLILREEQEVDTASYQVRMLMGNIVPSILKCRIQGVDGEFLVCYDITSRQSAAALFDEKRLGYQELQLLFGGFVQVMEEMSEYLLNPEQLVLLPEYMYVDVKKRKMYFCYLPGYKRDVREQFQELTEYILPRLDHEDAKAVMLGYGVYRRALEDSFHLEHVKEELFRGRGEEKKEALDGLEGEAFSLWEENRLPDPEEKIRDQAPPAWEEPWKEEPEKRKDSSGEAWWKVLCACVGAALGIAGVLAAKRFGYLPQVPVESLLGVVLCLMGILMTILWFMEKRGRGTGQGEGRKEKRQKEKASKRKTSKVPLEEGADLGFWEREPSERPLYQEKREEHPGGETEKDREEGFFQEEPIEETVVLCAGKVSGPATLVSREPGELATIYLKEDLTIIGKLENASDAVIRLPTVSRVHAKIRCRDGEYFLTDLNSRNGTAVNGQMLLPDQEYCLQDQDQVDFAQARYIFVK
ncbi:MAG: DUF6382 domain-containing protein [Eubacteriales bacterium]|nr:DUF6382 domain-containing protein [Eubacteriales bacterium]